MDNCIKKEVLEGILGRGDCWFVRIANYLDELAFGSIPPTHDLNCNKDFCWGVCIQLGL